MLCAFSEDGLSKMKIGLYVQRVASALGFENVVSAHVQLPLYTMKLLRDAGHTVQLITTEFGENRSLPNCLPKGVTVHQVAYGTRQDDDLVMYVGNRLGIHPGKLIRQLLQLKRIAEEEKYHILHVFGSNRLVYLAGLLRVIGINTPIVLTINTGHFPERFWFVAQHFWKRISAVITSTEFLKRKLETQGIATEAIKHGVVRDIRQEIRQARVDTRPHRVLFWRDPSMENGADICLQVYKDLAPRFPDVSFDLAVRPHWRPVAGLRELSEEYPNVNLYEFPYGHGITIAKLLAESVCVLLPFRELSAHPQFAVLESMQAGAAVVTTALDSNFELIDPGRNGYLVPPGDAPATVEAVERLLTDREHAIEIGNRAAEKTATTWNWDSYISELVQVYIQVIGQQPSRSKSGVLP